MAELNLAWQNLDVRLASVLRVRGEAAALRGLWQVASNSAYPDTKRWALSRIRQWI